LQNTVIECHRDKRLNVLLPQVHGNWSAMHLQEQPCLHECRYIAWRRMCVSGAGTIMPGYHPDHF
jgi:hypothetical protein